MSHLIDGEDSQEWHVVFDHLKRKVLIIRPICLLLFPKASLIDLKKQYHFRKFVVLWIWIVKMKRPSFPLVFSSGE